MPTVFPSLIGPLDGASPPGNTKLALIEDVSTGPANSDNYDLSEAQIAEVHRLLGK